MAVLKEGDRVRIASRTPTEDDAKAGTYYGHYAGLTGTIQKVYGKGEVSVEVEHDSLSKDLRKRHEDVRDQMKTKWIEGLSEEGRSKLTEREKDFNLRYVVLVALSDLEKAGSRPVKEATKAAPTPVVQSSTPSTPPPESAQRKTLAELEAAEEQELLKRSRQEA